MGGDASVEGYPGFHAVRVPFSEWASPTNPLREGERVLWSDGSARGWPEDGSEYINVLRRDDCDEQLDEPSAEEVARQWVAEHGQVEDDEQ